MKELDITQGRARTLSKKICNDFKISPCSIWFININRIDILGWYNEKSSNLPAYCMIEKNWSRRLVLLLHELTHHIQEELYLTEKNTDSPHGGSFQQARRRMSTWARNNISNNFDWDSLLFQYTTGKRKKQQPHP